MVTIDKVTLVIVVLFAMLVVGLCEAGVVAKAGIFGPVVSIGKCSPVFGAQIFYEVGVEQKVGEQLELGALGVAHFLDKVVKALGATSFPVKACYLKHAPHGCFLGCNAVDEARAIKAYVLFLLLCAVGGDMRGEVCGADASAAAERMKNFGVKVDDGSAGRYESAACTSGLNVDNGLDGCDVNSEFFGRVGIIFFGESDNDFAFGFVKISLRNGCAQKEILARIVGRIGCDVLMRRVGPRRQRCHHEH